MAAVLGHSAACKGQGHVTCPDDGRGPQVRAPPLWVRSRKVYACAAQAGAARVVRLTHVEPGGSQHQAHAVARRDKGDCLTAEPGTHAVAVIALCAVARVKRHQRAVVRGLHMHTVSPAAHTVAPCKRRDSLFRSVLIPCACPSFAVHETRSWFTRFCGLWRAAWLRGTCARTSIAAHCSVRANRAMCTTRAVLRLLLVPTRRAARVVRCHTFTHTKRFSRHTYLWGIHLYLKRLVAPRACRTTA